MFQRRRPYADHLSRWALYATILFVMACFVLGGASRADVIQQAIIRPFAIVFSACLLCFAPQINWRLIRWPGGLLLALAVLLVIQLVPLPYSVWAGMPGREVAVSVMEQIGKAGAWHGLSLTPDRTINSLFSLTVPGAMLLAMASLDRRDRRLILPTLIVAVIINMLLGFLQLMQGRFYIYRITNLGSAVGFFANRNHNAALIAGLLPLLGCVAIWPVHKHATRQMLYTISAGLIALSLLAILSIGSRWGLALGAVGLLSAIMVAWRDLRGVFERQPKALRITLLITVLVLLLGMVAIAALGARDESLRRLFQMDLSEDTRAQTLPVTLTLMRDMLPFGSGFGSFDVLYKAIEPRDLLGFTYLNHVHNDYIEVVIEGGLAAVALLLAALGWFVARVIASFRRGSHPEEIDRRIACAAGGTAVIALLASITDYPLRTPIWMLVLAACAVWLAGTTRRVVPKVDGTGDPAYASHPRSRPMQQSLSRLKV